MQLLKLLFTKEQKFIQDTKMTLTLLQSFLLLVVLLQDNILNLDLLLPQIEAQMDLVLTSKSQEKILLD